MKKIIDLLSLSFVLSFYLFHNIFFVIAGILLSIYAINKKDINHKIDLTTKIIKMNKNDIETIEKEMINNYEEEIDYSLIETVEELGIIPSIKRKKISIEI